MFKKKILFIVRAYSQYGPLAIRFQSLVSLLKAEYNIHVLELSYEPKESVAIDGVLLHSQPVTRIGKKILGKGKIDGNVKSAASNKSLAIKLNPLKRLVKTLLFPDNILTEIPGLNRRVKELNNEHHFDIVVASAFPHSTLTISKTIRSISKNIKFIYDLGDPFYKNSKNGYFKNILAKKYERHFFKYIDGLVVTNEPTKKQYETYYSNVLKNKQVRVIEQGINTEVITQLIKNKQTNLTPGEENKTIRLVYAGQFYKKLREPFELFKAIENLNSDSGQSSVSLDIFGSFNSAFTEPVNNNSNISFNGHLSNENILKEYLNADIIIFIDNAFGVQTPGKVFEVLAIGKPVLFITERDESPALSISRPHKHIKYAKNKSSEIKAALQNTINQKDLDFISVKDIEDFSWKDRASKYKDFFNLLTA